MTVACNINYFLTQAYRVAARPANCPQIMYLDIMTLSSRMIAFQEASHYSRENRQSIEID
jgi:hypothetical protein